MLKTLDVMQVGSSKPIRKHWKSIWVKVWFQTPQTSNLWKRREPVPKTFRRRLKTCGALKTQLNEF